MKPEEFSTSYAPLPLPRWLVIALGALIGCYVGFVCMNPPIAWQYLFWAAVNLGALMLASRMRIRFALTRNGQKLDIRMNRGDYQLTIAQLEPVRHRGKHWHIAWNDQAGPISIRLPDRAVDKPARKILQRLAKATASNDAA